MKRIIQILIGLAIGCWGPLAQEIDWYIAVIRQETAECNDEAYAKQWLGI